VLSLGSMAAIAGQVPAGLLVDAVPLKRLITVKALGSMLAALLMGYIGTHIAPGARFYGQSTRAGDRCAGSAIYGAILSC
jgi:hypothetical protein